MAAALLETLLDDINLAIRAADFDSLKNLIPKIEAIDLTEGGMSRESLEQLSQKAKRNSAAAMAAGRGIRAAQQRLRDIQENAGTLRTYDHFGQRNEVSASKELSKRL